MEPIDLASFLYCTPAFVAAAARTFFASAKKSSKNFAKATGLHEFSFKAIFKWLTIVLVVAAAIALVVYFAFAAARPPPPTIAEVVFGFIKSNILEKGVNFVKEQITRLPRVLKLFAIGAIAVYGLGVLAGALVPTAMSWFGEVVRGVGTIHAKGGIAATLQWLSSKPVAQAIGGCLVAAADALKAFFST